MAHLGLRNSPLNQIFIVTMFFRWLMRALHPLSSLRRVIKCSKMNVNLNCKSLSSKGCSPEATYLYEKHEVPTPTSRPSVGSYSLKTKTEDPLNFGFCNDPSAIDFRLVIICIIPKIMSNEIKISIIYIVM